MPAELGATAPANPSPSARDDTRRTGPADLKARILERIDAVQDPCSLAQAIPIGLAEMGLVTDVRIAEANSEGRHDVELVLRVTAPGCMYVPFMDRSIRAAVAELAQVGAISTRWDPVADWTPQDIAAPARKRIAESRARRLREARERAASRREKSLA